MAEPMAEKLVRYVIRLGIGGVLAINVSGELVAHPYKQIKGLKDENGVAVQVPERCQKQFNEVAMKFGLENTERVSLFVNEAFNAVSVGSTWLPGGAVIGLPRWYQYQTKEDVDDVEHASIELCGRDIKWDSKLGVAIKDSFYCPTDDMIAFTLGHELAHIQRLDFKLFDTFASPLWVYVTYRIANSTPKILKLHALLDVLLKLSICGINYYAYKFVKRKVEHLSEFTADEMSAKCDPRMAQGGIDVFTRDLNRNRALRSLLREKGRSVFTEEGNRVNSYSHPHFTDRVNKLKDILDRTDSN